MAASMHRRDPGNMEDNTQAINAAAKTTNSSLLRTSPYMKRSAIHPSANRTPPSRLSAPTPGVRKAKTPSKSPSTGCTSAPAGGTRTPAGGAPSDSTRSPAGRAPAAGPRTPAGGTLAAGTRISAGGVQAAGTRIPAGGAPAANTRTPAGGAPAANTRTPAGGAPAANTRTPAGGAPAANTRTPAGGAPAANTRTHAGGTPALNPSLKAKRGASSVSAGVARERHSAPSIPKEPRMMKCQTPHVLIPARLKRTGLKLLDHEKVKTLTSRLPVSDVKHNVVLRQTTINKQPPRSSRQNLLPRSSVRQTESSRKRMGITSRRENINQSGRTKIAQSGENTGGCQLSHQIDQLRLDNKGCDESRTGDSGEVYNGRPPHVQPGGSPDDARNSIQTVQDDAASSEESSGQNVLKSSPLTDNPTSGNGIRQDMETFVTESNNLQTGDVQEQLPGDKGSPSQPLCHCQESHVEQLVPTEDPPTEKAQSNAFDGSLEVEPTSEAQENGQSGHGHLKDAGTEAPNSQPASLVGESNPKSNSEEDLVGEEGNTIFGPNLPQDQQSETKMGNQEKPNQLVWSRTNDVIRQSQGVLVLTRSTDENAVFIPKLKFEFTPDNSIDWSALGPQPLGNNKGDPTKMNEPRVLAACTPRGPTFSKSVLKKNFMLPGQDLPGGSSESNLRFSGAEDVTRNNSHPLDRIVDLSISFQDKFEEQEIPADIPKILLTEDDTDED